MNAVYVGQNMGLGNASGCHIAEVGIYENISFTGTEALQLFRKASPPLVRPASLMAYWPMYGRGSTESDLVGGFDLTVNSATAAPTHPGVFK
jgi:hypothetical protein